MIRPLLTALTVVGLATPVMADTVYRCEAGSTMTYVDASREVRIKRPGEMTIAMPFAGALGRFSWWSPYEDSFECGKAPCAEYWQPQVGPPQVWFILDEGKKVTCATK